MRVLSVWIVSLAFFSFSQSAFSLPRGFSRWTPTQQQQYQYTQMQSSDYGDNIPSYRWGACMQLLGLTAAPAHIFHTFTNEAPESQWPIRLLLGGKMFHTQGVAAPIQFVSHDEHILEGMGRLSLGAPPVKNRFLPGFGAVFYEQFNSPVGIHTLHSLEPQNDTRFFLNDFSNRLSTPNSTIFRAAISVLRIFLRNPLHMESQHFVNLVARSGSDMSRFANATELTLKANLGFKDETRFLEGNFRREFRDFHDAGKLFDVWLTVGGEDVHAGYIRMKNPRNSPFIASKYGDYRFHIPHLQAPRK